MQIPRFARDDKVNFSAKPMAFKQVTIIGTGLIGGSLGLALKKRRLAGRIVGCDRAPVLNGPRTAAPSKLERPIQQMPCAVAIWWCWQHP
jgi:hypothetical protein